MMYLMGDEDGGVSLMCQVCDTGGKPFAYYKGIADSPWKDDVPIATSLEHLLRLQNEHLWKVHNTGPLA